MTDIYIISGFLGAGKTTLIQAMARSVFRNKRIVVIENDFGEAGIDAMQLKECNLTVTSLRSGCICCSLTGDFEKAMERILREYGPDAVLVEPSGVGKLSDVLKPCLRQEDQGRVHMRKAITVVDIRFYDKYLKNYGEFFEDQITYADLILLSHQEDNMDQIRHIEGKIREINPQARIESGFWESIPLEVFRYGPRNSQAFRLELKEAMSMKPVGIRKRYQGKGEKSGGRQGQRGPGFIRRHFAREVFSCVTLKWNTPLSEEQLRKKVLHVVKNAKGEILRGKGIVANGSEGMIFHFVPGSLEIEGAGEPGNQVCFIGTGLDEHQIQALFSEER